MNFLDLKATCVYEAGGVVEGPESMYVAVYFFWK